MASVVSTATIAAKLQTIGGAAIADTIIDAAKTGSVPAVELVAYLSAVIATPEGVDDQNIPGCTPANGTKITNFLRARAVMAT